MALSALSFAAGLFKDQGPPDGHQPVNVETVPEDEDTVLRFDEHNCPLHEHHVTLNKVH